MRLKLALEYCAPGAAPIRIAEVVDSELAKRVALRAVQEARHGVLRDVVGDTETDALRLLDVQHLEDVLSAVVPGVGDALMAEGGA